LRFAENTGRPFLFFSCFLFKALQAIPMSDYEKDFDCLMQSVCLGSEEAAWQIVDRYGEDIRQAVRRVLNYRLRPKFDSLDFVQLVWNSFFRVREKCDRFHRPEELVAYLLAMARNKVGMEIRRRLMSEKYNIRRELPFDVLRDEELWSHDPPPMDVAVAQERWENMLKKQPSHYRKIIQLRLQGYTFQDIGKAVHLDERSVRRFLQKLLDMNVL
jgi:RNA polymerase sigma factor (sigma-70 family)